MEQFIGAILPILFGAILVEAVVSALVAIIDIVKQGNWSEGYKPLLALVIGALATLWYSLDLFAAVGLVGPLPYVGQALSGIIISRGANYLYLVLKALNVYRKQAEQALGGD